MKKIVIVIDGYSSRGESTMAKNLACQLGYVYVDTDVIYRAVTLYALRHQLFEADGEADAASLQRVMSDIRISFQFNAQTGKPDTYLNDELAEQEIRTMQVSEKVSKITALPLIRTALMAQQQCMDVDKGIVMDGRDIEIVVFPHAGLEIFVTASAEVRAQRRYDELQQRDMSAHYDDILKNAQEHGCIDSYREVSPLRKADDTIELDNSSLTIDEQQQWLLHQVDKVLQQGQ